MDLRGILLILLAKSDDELVRFPATTKCKFAAVLQGTDPIYQAVKEPP